MDALHMAVMIGAITPEHSLSSHVGIGSKEHCLAGDLLMMALTSSTVAGLSSFRDIDISLSNIRWMKAGGRLSYTTDLVGEVLRELIG